MDLDYSADELAFRDEVRDWLSANIPAELRAKVVRYESLGKDELIRWHRILAAKGWIAPAWPRGVGRHRLECRAALHLRRGMRLRRRAAARAVRPRDVRAGADRVRNAGAEGSASCRGSTTATTSGARAIPSPTPARTWPRSRTTAVRRGDRYVVNGQKTWTTLAHMADWIFCLVRTDPDRERKQQEGISFLLIDLGTPGITVRPLTLMDGGHEVNEVFFDDVAVPADQLVHEEGRGWTVAKFLLGHERMNTARIGTSKRELESLKAYADAAAEGRPAAASTIRAFATSSRGSKSS